MLLKEVEHEKNKESVERVGWVCPRCQTPVSPDTNVCPDCSKDLTEGNKKATKVLMG